VIYASDLADVPIFLSSRLSRAFIVAQTNPAHNVCIAITLFFTYLSSLVPSDVQLFIRVVHLIS